ncbi:glycosyltransferase family 4 protein [Clostridium paraputrificum]|uniref:glycosyltransferase family 4 protein n=1 Tax=Clostridium paraputrificum TaxID=29363 RepID=UPI003567556B
MKICHIFGYGPDKMGAVENYILTLQEYCNVNNIEIVFIFTREPIQEFKSELEKLKGKYKVIRNSRKIFSVQFIISLYKYFKDYKPKVVHSHFDSANINVVIAAYLCKIEKIFWHQRNIFGKKLNLFRNIIYRFLSKRVTNIIAISQEVKNDLISRGIKKDKIILLHNGIKLKLIENSHNDTDIRKEFCIDKEKKIVLTVAQARPEKNIECLIRAIPYIKTKGLEFIVVGGGSLVPDLNKLAKELNIKNIQFIDKRNDIPDIMRQSDLFVLPSKREGLGNVLMEAMVNKLPIIASRTGGIPEVVNDEVSGLLFKSGESIELSEKIDLLINDKSLEEKFVKNGYEEVYSKFNIDKIVEYTFEQVYNLGDIK